MSFVIMTDTSANLSKEIASQNRISIVPMCYVLSGEEKSCLYPDDFADEAFYTSLKKGMRVTTSQINPDRYAEHMRPVLENGEDILFICLSSGVSGSFASAQIAKTELLEEYPERKIEVVDSLSAGLGEGLLVLRAIECRDQGMTLADTFQKINKMKHSIFQVFFVDDLMYLKHTGRVSGAVAAVGSILGIKPLLKGDPHGRIVACGKVRGRQQAIKALAEKYFTLAKNAVEQTVAITHTNCLKDAELLKDMLMAKLPPKKLILLKHEPATGSHLGPGALALFFEGDSDVRTR